TATFRNAKGVREAARICPVEQMLVETDAPFLAPPPYRGRPNEPYCVNYTIRDLAELRGVGPAEPAAATPATAEPGVGLGQLSLDRPAVLAGLRPSPCRGVVARARAW